MTDAATAGSIQQGHTETSGAGLFQRGEVGGGGEGGIGGCVGGGLARSTCQQRQGKRGSHGSTTELQESATGEHAGSPGGPLDY